MQSNGDKCVTNICRPLMSVGLREEEEEEEEGVERPRCR